MAYHPYPQLIPQLCNVERFGPPRRISFASAWPWVAHLVSCLIPATARPIQTRFRCASGCVSLKLATEINSLAHSPKGTPSGPYGPLTGCRHTVSGSFHSPRRGSFHLSLTVLVHYRSSRVFSLGGWTPQFPTGLACPVVLRNTGQVFSGFVYWTVTISGAASQPLRLPNPTLTPGPTTPLCMHNGLG